MKRKRVWTNPVVLAFMAQEKPYGLATLLRDLRGTRGGAVWKKGEVVKFRHIIGSQYSIERLKPKLSGKARIALPLLNGLAGVPRSALKIHDDYDKRRTQKVGQK